MRSKKGFLFTILTVALLLSVSTLAANFAEKSKANQELAVSRSLGEKVAYTSDDIKDSYLNLFGADSLSIIQEKNQTVISLANFTNTSTVSTSLAEFETFVETIYAQKVGVAVSLNGLDEEFSIEPYNITFQMDGDQNHIYSSQPGEIQEILVVVSTDGTEYDEGDGPGDDGSGNPWVNITVKGADGSVDYQSRVRQDITENNGWFEAKYDTPDGKVKIRFGDYNGQNGVLRIDSKKIEYVLEELTFIYNSVNETVKLSMGGTSAIETGVDKLRKTN